MPHYPQQVIFYKIAGRATSVMANVYLKLVWLAATHGFIATPCQRERARRTHLSSYVPRCRVDGTYDEVQCDINDGQCWCVDRDGREINATRGEGVIRCPTKGEVDRSLSQSGNYSIFHSVCQAISRSIGRSICYLVGKAISRSFTRSVSQSVDMSIVRSFS